MHYMYVERQDQSVMYILSHTYSEMLHCLVFYVHTVSSLQRQHVTHACTRQSSECVSIVSVFVCFGFFSFVLRISLLSFSLLRDAFGKDEAVRTMLGPLSGVMIKRGARPQSTTAINNEFPGSGEVQ